MHATIIDTKVAYDIDFYTDSIKSLRSSHHTLCDPSTMEPLYSGHPWPGEQHFGRYTGVAFIEGLFCTQTKCMDPRSNRGLNI